MQQREPNSRVNVGLLIFGGVFGTVCAALILAGVLSPTLWFTVVAMALLVLSQAIVIATKRRRS